MAAGRPMGGPRPVGPSPARAARPRLGRTRRLSWTTQAATATGVRLRRLFGSGQPFTLASNDTLDDFRHAHEQWEAAEATAAAAQGREVISLSELSFLTTVVNVGPMQAKGRYEVEYDDWIRCYQRLERGIHLGYGYSPRLLPHQAPFGARASIRQAEAYIQSRTDVEGLALALEPVE